MTANRTPATPFPLLYKELERRSNAYPKLVAALTGLTQISKTPDGGIVIGPQGWQNMRALLRELGEE